MKNITLNICILITFFSISYGCDSASQLYRKDDKNKISSGRLTDSDFKNLGNILKNTYSLKVNDTVIIKYDYNNDGCWNMLDQQNDDYIQSIITRSQQNVNSVLGSRPNISIFNFREPGYNINKIKKWNDSIIVDKDRKILNLLFNQQSTCGNSILIMPNRYFIFNRSDSHFEILELSDSDIVRIMNNSR